MNDLAERVEALRPRLVRLAYGQLGSLAEAEDVVQDAWLRLQRVDAEEIRDLEAWMITTVTRLALDALRSARVRREAYVGPWLPEPIVSDEPGPGRARRAGRGGVAGAARRAREPVRLRAQRVRPARRVRVRVRRGRRRARISTAAARQHASRARKAVEARRPRFPATPEQQREIVTAFGDAARDGDIEGLLAVLHPDVVLTSDGGGIVNAARKPLEGAARIARAMAGFARGARASRWWSSSRSTASPALRRATRTTSPTS